MANQIWHSTTDNLIAKLYPVAECVGVVIRKTEKEEFLRRGTAMALSNKDRKLVILGTDAADQETLTPAYILAEDISVDSTGDVSAVAYRSGNFNRSRIALKDEKSLSAEDEDNFRKYNIVFSDMMSL